jgi:aminoglycoside N3'-acetyltransferase
VDEVTLERIRGGARAAGLAGRPLCVHASLRSFGRVRGGAATVVEGLLAEGCTVLVPTFSYVFAVPPPPGQRPARNGYHYAAIRPPMPGVRRVFSPDSTELDRAHMGAVPAAVLGMPGHARGNHPLNSFSAVGPRARELIAAQRPLDVYAPLRRLADLDGAVVLMGVRLDRMTLLHLAEQLAGRMLFRRWANGSDGRPVAVEAGGCSDGFPRLETALTLLLKTVQVGRSVWHIYPAGATLRAAAEAIRSDPEITRCGRVDCERCEDAILGGPILPAPRP